ncbi:MAG: hypothetical protein SOR40_06480 [Rothia sp. (in: high G+C Gram-positive bacteria)]|nr:hypothetical protein [Rothia sp. (in: high G+C Gram-positive bacteria)]
MALSLRPLLTSLLLSASLLSLSACSSQQQVDQLASSPSPTGNSSLTASPSPSLASSSTPETSNAAPESSPAAQDSSPAEEVTAAEQVTATDSPAEPSPTPSTLTPPVNDGFTLDPVSLLTTDLVSGSPVADLAAYNYAAADQPSVIFQTPDPQVACLMQTYGVFCMTDDSKNWVLQSVSMGPGDTQPRTVQARGRAASHDWFQTKTVLPEGQSISWMGMTCTSTGPVSVQCNDGTTGFNLSDLTDR